MTSKDLKLAQKVGIKTVRQFIFWHRNRQYINKKMRSKKCIK